MARRGIGLIDDLATSIPGISLTDDETQQIAIEEIDPDPPGSAHGSILPAGSRAVVAGWYHSERRVICALTAASVS
ncbi:MAG: hypothetical protein WD651_02355 [Acidimicrobiia bacterium]